jgi:hypothetical protein
MRKPTLWITALLLSALLLAIMVFWLLNPEPLKRDPPRQLPWELPDHHLATKQVEYTADGTLKVRIDHALLAGITPEMVSWFYRILPISTIEYRGVTYPLYHFFHPTEHGTIWIAEPASDGQPGMGLGAVVARDEWFGPYDSRGAAKLTVFSDAGMVAEARVAGIQFGTIQHSFTATEGGTQYRLDAHIGTDLPLLGPLLNLYLRKQIYHPAMVNEWLRHQVEEVGSLPFLLPQIYAQQNPANHYVFIAE